MKNLINYLSKKSLSLGNGSGMTREWLGIASARPFTVLVLFLMLFSFGVVNVWGEDLNSSLTYGSDVTNNDVASSDAIGTYFTATWEKTSAQADPIYYNKSSVYGVKMYAPKNSTSGNTLTISTSTSRVYITGITITGQNAQGTTALYWQGTTSNTGTSKTFTAASQTQSVAIRLKETGNSKAGQYIVKSISVDYVVVTNVTLDKNGGDSDGSIVVTYNETAGADFSAASRAGYTCTGYYTASSDGTKVLNDDGTFAGNVSGWITSSKWSKSTNTATLYAQWVAAGCSNYSFHYGPHTGDWETPLCFTQVGSTHEMQIEDFSIPSHSSGEFYVGYQGAAQSTTGQSDKANSVTRSWDYMYFAASVGDGTRPMVGQATGATGTLRIYDNSTWENKQAAFIPDGYKLKFGSSYSAFTIDAGNTYYSDFVTYSGTNARDNVSVGIINANSSNAYVSTNNTQEMQHIFLNTGGSTYWGASGVSDFGLYDDTDGHKYFTCLMVAVPGVNDLYEGWVPSNCTKVIFCRLKSTTLAWGDGNSNVYNYTNSLVLQDNKNLWTVTGWGGGDGNWSAYEKTGKFRMDDNYPDKNWYVRFLPYHVLHYDANGGSGAPADQKVAANASPCQLTVSTTEPTRDNYTFLGWNESSSATSKDDDWDGGDTHSMNGDVTLYAVWGEILHDVTVEYKCGATTVSSSTTIENVGITTTGTTTAPASFTGYTWSTWSSMPSGVTTSTTPLTTRTIVINATADDKTITANYTANEYNITYKDQGNVSYSGAVTAGVPTGAPTTHTYGSATALVNGSKDGYTFNGWFTDEDCTEGPVTSLGATDYTADIVLYAKWVDKGCADHADEDMTNGATSSDDYGPLHPYYSYSVSQILYTRDDLGLSASTKKGTIKSIYFEYSGASAMSDRSIVIYMANTSQDALATDDYVPYSVFTKVYEGTFGCSSTGWYEIEFDTEFKYDGLGNLVVMIDDNTGSYQDDKNFKSHSASGMQIYQRRDGSDIDPRSWNPATAPSYRPNTKFCIQEEDMEMYTVSFSTGTGNDGVSPMTEEDYGEGILLPNGPTPDCADDGWVFAGWSETEYTTEPYVTNVGRLRMPGDYFYPDEDVTLYAVYRKLTSGTSSATYTANSRSNLTIIGAYDSEYWWYHTSTGVEFYINNYGIYDNKFDLYNSKGGANSDGWALIDAHRPITEISLTVTSGTPSASLSSTEPDAGTVTLDGSTITCTGNVTKVVVETPTTQKSEVYLSAFTVTYKNCEFFSNPTCCTKHDITLASSGSVTGGTFTSSVNRACATKSVTLTATPSNGGYVFNGWTVTNSSTSANVTTTVLGAGHANDNPATMTMPDYNVTITAAFSAISSISVKTAPTKTVYLEGETFDPTGLVITATYANSATVDVPYSGNEALFTLSPTTATALTTENASVSITYNGQTTSQSITVYSVTLQALDENGDAIRVGGPAAPTRDGATVTKAANVDNYVYKEWVVSGATLADGANANQKIITDPTGAVTVTVKYYLPRVVKWMVNGEEWKPYTDTGSGTDGTAEVARGAQWKTLTLPTDPNPLNDEGCGDKFIGWTNAEISGQLDKDDDAASISTLVDSNLLNSANKSGKTKTINANPYIFYAVFADYVE